jgi:uncharacterized metal-binding protein YceD (DUF177 family)
MTDTFSRPLPLDSVGPGGLDLTIEASPSHCDALAARMQIPAVLALSCRFRLSAGPGETVHARGHLRARVLQTCVVSLDPFESAIEEAFAVRFVPEGEESDDLDPEAEEDEIPYQGATLDLGETAAEQLALALDPYPRRPGASLPATAADTSPPAFAALAALQRRH